jgi:beta-mannosidase
MSSLPYKQVLQLTVIAYGLRGDQLSRTFLELPAKANGSTDFELSLPEFGQPAVVQATAHANGQTLATDTAWPEPFRFHQFARAGLSVVRDVARSVLTLRSERPAKGVWLAAPGLKFADNYIDLMPGQEVRVSVEGALLTQILIRALDQKDLCV